MIIHDLYFSFWFPPVEDYSYFSCPVLVLQQALPLTYPFLFERKLKALPSIFKGVNVSTVNHGQPNDTVYIYIYIHVKMLVSTGFPSLTNLLLNRFALCIALQWSLLILPFPRSSCFTAWALAHRTQCCGSKDGSELSDSSKLFEIRMSPWWSQT